jgi:starch-binding outer membrane protein, SusD/RagB family
MPETFPRMTVEEQVNKIDSLCDLAASQLPWYHSSENDYMRFSKASAMGLKVKVLLHAARPLFNSAEPYHPDGKNNLHTWYGNYSADRWKRAEAAGKAFMEALNANGYYNLIQPKGNTHDDYREAFVDGYHTRMMGEGNREALISWLPVGHDQNGDVVTRYQNAVILHWHNAYWWMTTATLEFINMFPFKDGTDFPENFDWSNPPFNPWFDEIGKPSRDPRLYETVVINGDRWGNRTAETWAPGNGYAKGREAVARDGIGTFKHRKFLREQSPVTTWNKPIQISFLRLPEFFLSYAEAINEANGGPNAIAYDMINRIRNRVGLPDLTPGLSQEEFREALIRERAIELYMEQVPWYDITFWKQDKRLRKRLHSMQILRTNNPEVWEYKVFEPRERYWWTEWDNKWYLWPFPQSEIDKGYGLVQNPGW